MAGTFNRVLLATGWTFLGLAGAFLLLALRWRLRSEWGYAAAVLVPLACLGGLLVWLGGMRPAPTDAAPAPQKASRLRAFAGLFRLVGGLLLAAGALAFLALVGFLLYVLFLASPGLGGLLALEALVFLGPVCLVAAFVGGLLLWLGRSLKGKAGPAPERRGKPGYPWAYDPELDGPDAEDLKH